MSEGEPVFAVPEGFAVDRAKVEALEAELKKRGVEFLLSTYVDIHGVPKAKVNPVGYLGKMARGSELFTVGAMEGMGLVGPQEDECAAVPDLDSLIVCPWDERFGYFFGDLYYHGEPYANDSRQVLKRQEARAAAMGLEFKVGMETEFYVWREDGDDGGLEGITGRRFRGVCPAYDVHQSLGSMEFLEPMVKAMESLGWGVYSFDQEGGHSQYELDFDYADVLTMSDRLVFLRLMAKQIAGSLGMVASFMPKPFADDFRSGCHFNMSLWDGSSGANVFAPEPGGNELMERYGIPLSRKGYHFMGGLLKHAGALTAVSAPTYNSYQGFIAQGDMPDVSWAPVMVAYGRNNRSAMLRLPLNRYCVENRAPDMSHNPYLATALHLAAGLEGIEEEVDPGAPLNDNLYGRTRRELKVEGLEFLPGTLLHALEAFDADPLVDKVFGEMKDIFYRQKMGEWEREFYAVRNEQREERLTFL